MNTPTLYTNEGERELPFKWVICTACDGHGQSSAYLGAYTRDQLEEQGTEFIEAYIAGEYDRACDACGGAGKVKVADRAKMSKADRALFDEQEREELDTRETERRERLMEGGWREEGWFE